MSWPTDTINTTNVDASSDDPSQARANIYTAMQLISAIIAGRNTANGVAPLDGSGLVPDANIPAAIARLASPALTGTPTAPTPAAADNSTKIATTAYADAISAALTALINAKAPLASPSFTGAASFAGTASFAGAVQSTKSAASGYTRISPNFCLRTAFPESSTSMTIGSTAVIAAPAGATAVLVKITSVINGGNTLGATTYSFTDILDASGNQLLRVQALAATELAASAAVLAYDVTQGIALVSGGNIRLLPQKSGAGSVTTSYYIAGYYD